MSLFLRLGRTARAGGRSAARHAAALDTRLVGELLDGRCGCACASNRNSDGMKELASHLKPGSSALLILVKEGQPKQVYAEVEKFRGKILQTRLAHQDETKIEAALAAAKQ